MAGDWIEKADSRNTSNFWQAKLHTQIIKQNRLCKIYKDAIINDDSWSI